MNLNDVIERPPLKPWQGRNKIPWDDPAFSERMLREHLDQSHDLASRRAERIDALVAYLHERLLGGRPSRVLDLCCGPGLYTTRLARLGHTCVGVDFAPASIRYANEQAALAGLDCAHHLGDVRQAAPGDGFDAVLMIYGEFDVFTRDDAKRILQQAHAALKPGGRLAIEAHRYDTVQRIGEARPAWSAHECGLFADRPHLVLHEAAWDEAAQAAAERWYVIDSASAEVHTLDSTTQAYTPEQYRAMFTEAGFVDYRQPNGLAADADEHFALLIATRPGD